MDLKGMEKHTQKNYKSLEIKFICPITIKTGNTSEAQTKGPHEIKTQLTYSLIHQPSQIKPVC